MRQCENIIAILRGITPDEVVGQIACLLEYGITSVEIPTNSPYWQTSVERARVHFGSALQLGVGTVLDAQQVKESAAAGADFILTPNLDERVVSQARASEQRIIAGVFSASEVFQAVAWGIRKLKIFPASALPLDYPAQIKGPLAEPVSFTAVGGVSVANAADYLRHYDSVGIGSSLYKPGQPVSLTVLRCRELQDALR